MASLMENLIAILEKECQEYRVLLDLSKKKTPIIVKNDLNALTSITDEEQTVVSRINHLDEERKVALADIANVINKDVETLKLDNVINMLKGRPSEQEALRGIHDSLKELTDELRRVNENNRKLLETSLEMVGFEMNLLQSLRTAPETANYNKGGMNSGYTMGTAPSGFDAKQ